MSIDGIGTLEFLGGGVAEVELLVPEDGTIVLGANTYVSLAQAQAYAATRLGASAFAAATGDDAETAKAALIMATNRLDLEMWTGARIDPAAQRLQWPRQSVYDPYGVLVPVAPLPRFLTEATTELAIALYADAAALDVNPLAAFEALTVGPITLQTRGSTVSATVLPDMVQYRIAPYLAGGTGASATVRLVRG